MYKNQFPEFQFISSHNKPNVIRGLIKHYNMRFDPKLGHGKFAIRHISCACTLCTSIIEQPWAPYIPAQQKPRYQPVKDCTYCPVLGSFNN